MGRSSGWNGGGMETHGSKTRQGKAGYRGGEKSGHRGHDSGERPGTRRQRGGGMAEERSRWWDGSGDERDRRLDERVEGSEKHSGGSGASGRHSEGGRKRRQSRTRDGKRRRNERGQYVETVEKGDILDLMDRIPGPVITTTDVATAFDITTEGARRKLNDLCEAGLLDRRKTGQTRLYWRIEAE